MISVILQITIITSLTCCVLIFNRPDSSGNNTNLITLCFFSCLIAPLISLFPHGTTEITLNNTFHETISPALSWETSQAVDMTQQLSNQTAYNSVTPDDKEPSKSFNIENLLFNIWLAGMILSLLFKCTRYRALINMIKKGELTECIDSKLSVLTSDLTDIPFLLVHKKGYIVLPTEVKNWSPKHKQNIIAHEQCHYERKDHWHLLVANILTTVYWFHPFVKYLSNQQSIEIESACDTQLINDGIDTISYAETLLAFVDTNDSSRGYASMATKPKQIQLRIRSVLQPQSNNRNKFSKMFLVLLSAVLLSAGCTEFNQLTWLPSSQMIAFISHDLPTMRESQLTENQVLISAFYDGKENNNTYVHLEIQNDNNEASWLALGPLKKFDEYIHTWHFKLKDSSYFTGEYKVIGAEKDGVVDGVALGLLTVDTAGSIELLKTKSKLNNNSTPNFICAWPLGLSEPELLKLLPQLTVNSPDAVERILCGSQLVQNGQHRLN